MFSANSVPLVLEVLDLDLAGHSIGFAEYQQRIGNFAIYTFEGRQYKIDLTVFRSKHKTR